MTNLTEQYRKGELKDGKYWIKLSYGAIITADYTEYDGQFTLDDHYYDDEEIKEVLYEVLSYEETVAMKDCARMLWLAAEREVKLKELLKECRKEFDDHDHGVDCDAGEFSEIIAKIDQVLGE